MRLAVLLYFLKHQYRLMTDGQTGRRTDKAEVKVPTVPKRYHR